MGKILRRREIVEDDWERLGAEPPGGAESIIIPFAELKDKAAAWEAWRGRLGVQLEPADKVEDLAPYLAKLSLVACHFTGPGEGRGYTQARLLRERYKFGGELRAVGHVKRDQLFLMSRAGFDSFELSPGENPDDALRYLSSYSVAYQPGASNPAVGRLRTPGSTH